MPEIPASLGAALDPNLPVALLPIRLETRFGSRPHTMDDGTIVNVPVLRIRIYPDEISVVTSAPGMSSVEQQAGLEFWTAHEAPPTAAEVADPGALAHRRTAAWELLVRHVGRERAAFVANSTRPGAPPAAAGGAPEPATARLLPDSWVVVGYSGGQRVLATHVPGVPEHVQVGPSRTTGADAFDPKDPNLLKTEDGLRWVTDFDEAERIAMAVTVDLLDPADIAAGIVIPMLAINGLDTLMVFGLREPKADRSAASEADALVDLLSAHAATDRVAFVPQGTPTNNADGRASGWTSAPDIFAAYERVVGAGPAPAPATGVDALRGGADNATTAAAALGLAPDALVGLDGANALEQWPARAMARALFPVTVGEVLGTLSRPPLASVDDVERQLDRLDELIPFAAEHMASFVRSRGPLPVLRVGRQPYGLLPILPIDRWVPRANEPAELPNLVNVLGVLRPFWDHAAGGVPRFSGGAVDLTNATDQLVRILGLGAVPHPGAYQVRDVTGQIGTSVYSPTHQGFFLQDATPDTALTLDRVRDAVSADVRLIGYRALLAMTLPGLVRGSHFEAMQLQGSKPLRVSVARSDPNRAGWETVPTYLSRLTATFDLLHVRLQIDVIAQPKPTDLLFVLAEHAMALSGELDSLLLLRHISREAATTVANTSPELLRSGLSIAEPALAVLSSPIGEVRLAEDPPVSAALEGASVYEVVADRDLFDRAREEYGIPRFHLDGFPGTRDAINALANANLTDAEYTRLTGEALSCCTNRLDAWYTSVAAQRLADLRADQPTGVQLGCWGVLVDLRPHNGPAADSPAGWDPAIDDGASGAAVSWGPLLAPNRNVGYVHAPSLAQARTAGVLRAGELTHAGDGTTLASLDLTSRRARIARDMIDAIANGLPLGAVLGYRLERTLGDAGLHDAVTHLRAAFPQRRSEGAAGAPAGADNVVPPEVLDGLDVWQAGDAAVALAGVAAGEQEALALALADLKVAVEAVADVLVAEGVHHVTSGRAEAAGATFAAIASGSHPPLDLDVLREPRSGIAITNRLVLLLDETGGADGWDRDRVRATLAPEVERWAESILGPPSRWRAKVGDTAVSLADLGPLCALDVVVDTAAAGASRSPIEQQLVAFAGAAADAVIVADGDGPPWPELLALTAAVRDVLEAARPVVPADLDPGPQETNADAGIVKGPAGPTIAALETIARRIADALDSADPAIVADAERVIDSIVTELAGTRREKLLQLCHAPRAVDILVDLARRIAGSAVIPLPEVQSALPDHLLVDGAPKDAEVEEWLGRAARVRRGAGAYDDLRLFVEAAGGEPDPLTVAQLPLVDGEAWLGGPLATVDAPSNELRSWARPTGPRAHVVAAGKPALAGDASVHGLVLDEYVEVLPAPTVTTGVALHYDAPNARPPQSVLLALHPDPSYPWDWEFIEQTVLEALALARLRLVELDDLASTAVDEYFPLTYLRDGVGDTTPVGKLTEGIDWSVIMLEATRIVAQMHR